MNNEQAVRFGAAVGKRPVPPPAVVAQRKFTVLLDVETAEAFDSDVARVRRAAGRTIAKSEIVRELLAALHNDASLLAEVAHRLQHPSR